MKKKAVAKFTALVALVLSVCFALTGCFGDDSSASDQNNGAPKEYTIQYTDDAGTHTLKVTEGAPYALESVPYQYGYEFLGLFDAEVGGTQYVGANGASLAPFREGESLVLFPQFEPIEYTIVLDYGKAAVTGARSVTAAYGSELPELPKDIVLAHSLFTGWYTEQEGKGTQIADAFGNIPVVSVLNEKNFKLDDENRRAYLYAGFEAEKHTLTCNFGGDIPSETLQVPYDTPIGTIVPKTRNENGEAVLVWSKTQDGAAFSGNITEDTTLYAKEWAPVIELNGNGAEVTPIVAKAGTAITLPTPVKPLAKFLRWEDENGQTKNITVMPNESIVLNAVWQAKIEFDENGGMSVDDISKPIGESISLPIPTRDGYIFAGWYTTEKQHYSETKMPAAGVALKAGWYKAKQKIITVVEQNFDNKVRVDDTSYSTSRRWKIDLADILKNIPADGVTIDYVVNYRWAGTLKDYSATAALALYDGPELNSSYQLKSKSLSHTSDNESYIKDSFSGQSIIHTNVLYLYYSGSQKGSWGSTNDVAFYDVYLDLTYPDTTYLYL